MNKTMNQSQNYTDLKKKSLIDNHRKKSYCEQTNADKLGTVFSHICTVILKVITLGCSAFIKLGPVLWTWTLF